MGVDSQRWGSETRMLFRVALAIFTVTVLIGILNGFHFTTLSRAVLLTHVHAGTLGWITLSAFGAAYWLYSGAGGTMDGHARGVARAMAVAVPLYVLAFLSGNFVLRAIFGTPVLLLIVGMVVFLLRNRGTAPWSVPRLGVLLAFTVLVIGSTIGVLIQIQLAANHTFLPDGAVGGHAAAQVTGYLVLFALSTIDWRLQGTHTLGWAGGIQVGLLAIAGVLVAAGALFNVTPLLGAFIPLQLIGLVIFLVRVGRPVINAKWLEPSSNRHFAIAVPWAIVNIVVIIIAIQIAIGQGFEKVPFGLFIAGDHAMFIGVMTNVVFALVQDFTVDRRQVWPWAENVVFWVMNIALIGFVVSLITGAQWAEKFFVPFQGLAILVGIVAYSMRLASPTTASSRPAIVRSA